MRLWTASAASFWRSWADGNTPRSSSPEGEGDLTFWSCAAKIEPLPAYRYGLTEKYDCPKKQQEYSPKKQITEAFGVSFVN